MHHALALLQNTPAVFQQIKAHAYHHGTPPAGAGPPLTSHSPDFTSLYWFGTAYHFPRRIESNVIREYYLAWQANTPCLRIATALERAGSFQRKMGRLFLGHAILGVALVSVGRGVYRLQEPQ
jgi:hypothetical protein